MDKTMDYYNCYSPLCPWRETCILWLNALERVERGENLLCVINPKILEAAGGYDHCPLYYEYKLRQFARGLIWSYREITILRHGLPGSNLNTRASKSIMSSRRESRVGQRTNFSNR